MKSTCNPKAWLVPFCFILCAVTSLISSVNLGAGQEPIQLDTQVKDVVPTIPDLRRSWDVCLSNGPATILDNKGIALWSSTNPAPTMGPYEGETCQKIPGVQWTYRSATGSASLIRALDNRLYIYDGKNLVGLDRRNGKPVHTLAAAGADALWPYTGTVLLKNGNTIDTLELASGKLLWTKEAEESDLSLFAASLTEIDAFVASPTDPFETDVDRVLPEMRWGTEAEGFGEFDIYEEFFVVLSSNDDKLDWIWEDPSAAYVNSGFPHPDTLPSNIRLFETATGDAVLDLPTSNAFLDRGVLYISSNGGKIYAVDVSQISETRNSQVPPTKSGYAATALTGSLRIQTAPDNAHIMVDGEYHGRGPRVLDGCIVGQHEINAYLPGFAPVKKLAIVTSGGQTAVNIALEQGLGRKWGLSPENGAVKGSIAISNLIIAFTKNALHALTQSSGKEVWVLPMPDVSHVVADKHYLLYATPREIGVVTPQSGRMIWRDNIDEKITWMAFADGVLLTVNDDSLLVARDVANGTVRWEMSDTSDSPLPFVTNTMVVCRRDGDDDILILNIYTGHRRSKIKSSSTGSDMVTWYGDFILVYSSLENTLTAYHQDGSVAGRKMRLHALPMKDNGVLMYRQLWAIDSNEFEMISILPQNGSFFSPIVARMPHVSSGDMRSAVSRGTAFVSCEDSITAFDALGGTAQWSKKMTELAWLQIYRNMVLAYHDNVVECVDPGTGETLIMLSHDDPIDTVFQSANHFFVLAGGKIHAYGIES